MEDVIDFLRIGGLVDLYLPMLPMTLMREKMSEAFAPYNLILSRLAYPCNAEY